MPESGRHVIMKVLNQFMESYLTVIYNVKLFVEGRVKKCLFMRKKKSVNRPKKNSGSGGKPGKAAQAETQGKPAQTTTTN